MNINLPPTGCKFSVKPFYGVAFKDKFTLDLSGCVDSDSPFTYRFTYYYSPRLYDLDLLKG